MTKDRFGREINYLRISVTDRCNLRCIYCMPEEGIPLLHHDEILSFDDIVDFSTFAVSQGINKIRLTGGEPLVRKGICTLINSLSHIKGLKELSLTTNGQLLPEMGEEIFKSGLNRINISLDTINPTLYSKLSRGGSLQKVLDGIQIVKKICTTPDRPIKINSVLMPQITQQERYNLEKYAKEEGLQLRYIKCMDLSQGTFSQVIGGNGGDCPHCNRLRLSAVGELKPCLFSDLSYNIKKMGYKEAFEAAISNKPKKGIANNKDRFYTIGG